MKRPLIETIPIHKELARQVAEHGRGHPEILKIIWIQKNRTEGSAELSLLTLCNALPDLSPLIWGETIAKALHTLADAYHHKFGWDINDFLEAALASIPPELERLNCGGAARKFVIKEGSLEERTEEQKAES